MLSQRTGHCRFAAGQLLKRFGERLQHEEIQTVAEGREAVCGTGRPAMLIWGDGRSHHLSNALNIPGGQKLVFDKHPDNACSLDGLDYDNHNDASVREGLAVMVCYAIEEGRSRFAASEGRAGNSLFHVSIDLDFVKGFPALPYMSLGTTGIEDLCSYLEYIVRMERFVRFDIGGYNEMTGDFSGVFSQYYERPLEIALSVLISRLCGWDSDRILRLD